MLSWRKQSALREEIATLKAEKNLLLHSRLARGGAEQREAFDRGYNAGVRVMELGVSLRTTKPSDIYAKNASALITLLTSEEVSHRAQTLVLSTWASVADPDFVASTGDAGKVVVPNHKTEAYVEFEGPSHSATRSTVQAGGSTYRVFFRRDEGTYAHVIRIEEVE